MSTKARISWGLYSARRAAAACDLKSDDADAFARLLAPKIADIAREIIRIEKRRGPREIALYMLRNFTGRRVDEILAVAIYHEVEVAARKVLDYASEGLLLVVDNTRPRRTPRPHIFITIFNPDGRRSRWEQIADQDAYSDRPGRSGGAA